MAVIYSYPVKSTPELTDKMLISDGTDNLTKQVTISGVKDTIDVVDSLAATLPIEVSASSGAVTVSSRAYAGAATTGYVPTGGSATTFLRGDGTWVTPTGGAANPAGADTQVQYNSGGTAFGASTNLTFATDTLAVKHTVDIKGQGQNLPAGKLKLNCELGSHAVTIEGPLHNNSGGSYTLKLPSLLPQNNQILQFTSSGNLGWINTPTGSGGVSSFTNTNGTFISAGTANSSATGAVTMGTIDLSATGTASNTTFLRGDNTWATPSSSGGISFSGSTANGIATYSSATQANVSSVFTVSGNKLSAPAGSVSAPSLEVGAVGGLYAASGGIFLAHSSANAIGVNSSSIVNYKLTQFDAGLKFGSAGGTLNKYEEGTWTPTAYAVVGSSPTVASSNGTYTIIGDICHITFKIVVTGSSSQNVTMIVGSVPAAATADSTAGEKSAGQLFVNSDTNTPQSYPSIFSIQGNLLTMIVQGGSKNSATTPLGLKAVDATPSWYRPSGGTGITLEGSATYKLA